MITRIARKEFTEMVRDGRFRVAAALVMALLVAALAAGWKHHVDSTAQRLTAERITRAQWLNQGARNPHSAAHYGVWAFRPQSPLASIDPGIEKYVGTAVWLEAHRQNEFRYKPASDATAAARFGELTAAVVLQLLLPLVIVLLSFGAFAAERDNGTLRQLLSLGVSRSDLALGKALGVASALAVLLVPATALGIAALALSAGTSGWGDGPLRLWLMGLGYLLYFGAFVGLSIAVSARARSAQLALVVLVGFWIVNGLVAPRAVADLARGAFPGPSSFAFTQAVREDITRGADGHNSSDKRLDDLKAAVLKKYGVKRVEDLPVNFDALSLQAGEDYGNTVYDKHYTRLWDTYRNQNAVHQWGAAVAPLLAVRSLSMGLAGSDFEQHRHFATAAENHRRLINRIANEEMLKTEYNNWNDEVPAETWAKFPEFRYGPPGVDWVLGQYLPSIGLMLAWCVLATAAAYWATGRLRPS
ncbi:MAG: DUF3526 domain-containing protein [Aphanocapsa lilacina HA4352-LM1]|nr:DUF3526 domain-containing protein [Aphanocapsa lilacina HA4352-LM1]